MGGRAMTDKQATPICSSHPDVCCQCCGEFQSRIEEEKALYMENEKEWQSEMFKVKAELEEVRGFLELSVEWNKTCRKMVTELSGDQAVADKLNKTIQHCQEALRPTSERKEI